MELNRDGPVAYREASPDDGATGERPPVVCVHGFPESSLMWEPLLEAVAGQGHRGLAPDLYGFGDSIGFGPGTFENSRERFAEWIEATVGGSVVLVVHDWGGFVGLPWACENPGRIAGLVLSDTGFFADGKWHGMAEALRSEGGEELIGALDRDAFAHMLDPGGDVFGSEAVDAYWAPFADGRGKRATLEFYRSMDMEKLGPWQGKLAEIGAPTLLLWGAYDQFAPLAGARRFEREIPGARLVALGGAGHFVFDEERERCVAEVDRVPRRRGRGWRLSGREADADRAPVGAGADLDQVAELIHQPQAAPGSLVTIRAPAPDQRVREPAAVVDLTKQRARLPPDGERATPPAVADAVHRQLVHREHQIGLGVRPQPRVGGVRANEPADGVEPTGHEFDSPRLGRWLGELAAKRVGDHRRQVSGAGSDAPAVDQLGMVAPRRFEHVRVESGRVVGTEQREGLALEPVEGVVEERFVAVALGQLGRAAPGPGGFADPAHRPPGPLGDELAPGGDDPGGIAPQRRHLREPNGVGRAVETRPDEPGLALADRHQHRLARLDPGANERHRAAQKLPLAAVEQRLMTEAPGHGHPLTTRIIP